jgi:glycosyltransferase involved in cell wall biosynthesis
MVPVEAMAWGTSVIAHASGGPLETVQDGLSGLFFEELSVEGLVGAMQQFQQQGDFDSAKIHLATSKYSTAHFQEQLRKLI